MEIRKKKLYNVMHKLYNVNLKKYCCISFCWQCFVIMIIIAYFLQESFSWSFFWAFKFHFPSSHRQFESSPCTWKIQPNIASESATSLELCDLRDLSESDNSFPHNKQSTKIIKNSSNTILKLIPDCWICDKGGNTFGYRT